MITDANGKHNLPPLISFLFLSVMQHLSIISSLRGAMEKEKCLNMVKEGGTNVLGPKVSLAFKMLVRRSLNFACIDISVVRSVYLASARTQV